MNLHEEIEKMSEAELQAILDTDCGEELEKEAAAEVAQSELVDALYAYGAMTADQEIEALQGDLSKEASEHFAAAEAELSSLIEQGVNEAGLGEIEDEVELHKQAQAAAAVIFAGYTDQIEKIAEGEAKAGKMDKVKAFLGKAKEKVGEKAKALGGKIKGAGEAAGKHLKANKGVYGAAAGGLALGAGAMALKKHHEKKASEMTIDELAGEVLNKMDVVEVVEDGIEKCAGLGAKAVDKMKHFGHAAKEHVKKHGKQYGAGAGGAAAGALGLHLARRKAKKDKK